MHCRSGISLLVYQNPVMRVSPLDIVNMHDNLVDFVAHGVTAASKIPMRNRIPTVNKSQLSDPQNDQGIKNLHALEYVRAWVIMRTVKPHSNVLTARTF